MLMLSKKTLREAGRLKKKRVLLQVPEGLKTKAQRIAEELERLGAEVFISCDPCFGACDLRGDEARRLGCDLIVHVGHSDMGVRSPVPVIYDQYPLKANVAAIIEKHAAGLKGFKCIGLATTLQYGGSLKSAEKVLKKGGFRVFTAKGKLSGIKGQVLGCEYGAAKMIEERVDCFLFIGSGCFHPAGLAAAVEKPVFFLDVEAGSLSDVTGDAKRETIRRALRLERARDCQTFGILVSTKPGQARPEEASRLKKMLESKGKRAWILAMDRVTPESIMGIGVECLVNTACPRLREDSAMFGKVIINPAGAADL